MVDYFAMNSTFRWKYRMIISLLTISLPKMNVSDFNHTNQDVPRDCFNQPTSNNVSGVLFNVSDVIRQVVPPAFICVGLLGNPLTMAVLLRQGMTNTFTGVSLLVLAVVDNINIMAYFLPEWLGAVAELDFRSSGNTICKTSWFFAGISQTVSAWTLVVITVERIACVWPLEIKKRFTPRLSLCVHALLFAAATAMSVYVFEVFEVSERALNVYGSACGTFAHLDETDVTTIVLNHVASVMIFHVPLVLLIAGHSVIFLKVSVRRKFALKRGDATSTTRHRNLSFLVIALTIVFFFSQLPLCVFILCDAQVLRWVFTGSCTDKFWHRLGVSRLAWACCNVMALVSPSTNFLLYFISSASFRQEIKAFFKCDKAGGRIILFNDEVGTASTTV